MNNRNKLAVSSLLAALVALPACGGGNNNDDAVIDAANPDAGLEPAPKLRNPVDLPDGELALKALALLGADVAGSTANQPGSCDNCHGVTTTRVRNWSSLTDTSTESCLIDLNISNQAVALEMATCFQDAAKHFSPRKLGIWATGATLPWFRVLFDRAYGATADTEYADFVARAAMPVGGFAAMTQANFDIVAEWFVRGTPQLDESLDEGGTSECTPLIGPEVASVLASSAVSGWKQTNADNDMAMYGCAGAANVFECMSDQPNAASTAYGATWSVGSAVTRVLTTIPATTSYWSRGSADGRFFASGQGTPGGGSSIIDLTNDHQIAILDAYYDPAFFPDNRGWVFQGGGQPNVCDQSILLGSPTSITMGSEAGCAHLSSVGLYQHVGRAGATGDYFSVSGQFANDNFGHGPSHEQPQTSFGGGASVRLTPMIFNGVNFEQNPSTSVAIPREGDAVLSENASLMINRMSSGAGSYQIGYALRTVNKTMNVDGSYNVTAPVVARYCETGSKPAFSYDDKFAVFHHYIERTNRDAAELGFDGSSDPDFADYSAKGASNIYVLNLATGESVRITNMKPGQYAQYPHFRSDGWIYYLVRDNNSGKEYAVATDAGLRLE